EASSINKRVFVRADPQLLGAGAGLDVVECRQHARLEDVEPGGDVKSRDVDGTAEVMPGAKGVGCRMANDLVEKRLPGGKIRVAGQRQSQPIRRPDEWRLGMARGLEPLVACRCRGGDRVELASADAGAPRDRLAMRPPEPRDV